MKKAFLLIILLAGIGYAVQALQKWSEVTSDPFYEKSPAEIVELARGLDTKWTDLESQSKTSLALVDGKELPQGRAALAKIQKGDPKFEEAQKLLQNFQRHADEDAKRKQEIKREATALVTKFRQDNVEGRKDFAKKLEQENLKAGRDVQVSTSGPKNTTLKFEYILVNRPFIYQIQNQTKFLQNATDAGFTTVIFSNGHDDQWTFQLKP